MKHTQPNRFLTEAAGATALLLVSASAHADSGDADWLAIAYLWGSGITIDA